MKQDHILVIGGTRGLGRTVVKMLGSEGCKLSIIARSEPIDSGDLAENSVYLKADLLDEHSYLNALSTVIETRGRINGLIFLQRFRGSSDHWEGNLEVGLNATRKIIDYLTDKFDEREYSNKSIVMVSSIAGELANHSQPVSYSIAKAGLNHMVKFYSSALGKYGIRVNAVSPITFIKDESKKYYLEENQTLNQIYQKIVPLKRMCTAEDVANAISFLCGGRSSYISGQNITIDGGLSVRSHETLAFALSDI